ncbi:MAG: HAD family hydrolase, partial [Methanomicrobiales archaeon]|nr:HAD family hydrolase [Methanomicrobiales archaeon]
VPLYVVSATPEEEIRRIVSSRGLDSYFSGVYGSPGTKAAAIGTILAGEGVPPSSALFVGDAVNDLEAAQATGVRFAARVRPGDRNRFAGKAGVDCTVPDLEELLRLLVAGHELHG